MDTNSIIALVKSLQKEPFLSPNSVTAIVAFIAMATAWIVKRTEEVHKAVNSTATKLAEEKILANAISAKQTEEIATLREELRNLKTQK